jgi:tryptophanyl-tRNA synthetase
VPVGEDQEQHLELARDVAKTFNSYYKKDFFPSPKSILSNQVSVIILIRLASTKRVMSLKNASEKMSKSNPNDNTRINLTDTADQIAAKIRKATTDTTLGSTFSNHPFTFQELLTIPKIEKKLPIYSQF